MAKKRDTGSGTPYSGPEEGVIANALDQAMNGGSRGGSRIRVTARIEWAGVEQNSNGGVRTTTLDGITLGPVQEAVQRAREAQDHAEQVQPYRSYDAKGWQAQLGTLLDAGDRGSTAADRAGLAPSDRTVLSWLSGDREPSKANQARIHEAYDALRNREVIAAQEALQAAQHEVAEKFNAAVSERYGADVRLRDISNFSVE